MRELTLAQLDQVGGGWLGLAAIAVIAIVVWENRGAIDTILTEAIATDSKLDNQHKK